MLFETEELQVYYKELQALVFEGELDPYLRQNADDVLNGRPGCHSDDREYSHYIQKLKTGKIFNDFSAEDKDKIILLVQIAYIGIVVVWSINLPLNLYGKKHFSKEYRGKLLFLEQDSTRSQNLGLLKSYMPLPRNDVALSEHELPYLKGADQAMYDENADWVVFNFNQLVHPFSNSISGTILAQIRVLAQLQWYLSPGFVNFSTKLTDFFKLLIAARLYHNGGHSLHEFVSPFYIERIQDEFIDIPKFSEINLTSMFFDGNEPAFDKALDDTLDYNRMLLKRASTRQELMNKPRSDSYATCAETTRFFSRTIDTEWECDSRLDDASPTSVVDFMP